MTDNHTAVDEPPLIAAAVPVTADLPAPARPAADTDRNRPGSLLSAGTAAPSSVLVLRARATFRCPVDRLSPAPTGVCISPLTCSKVRLKKSTSSCLTP